MEAETVLFVADQPRAAAFYAAVLAAPPRLDVPGMTEFDLAPGAVLGLMPTLGIRRLLPGLAAAAGAPGDPAGLGHGPSGELYLLAADPEALLARALAAGARLVDPMAPRSWGHRAGYVLDPDGHLLVFAGR